MSAKTAGHNKDVDNKCIIMQIQIMYNCMRQFKHLNVPV